MPEAGIISTYKETISSGQYQFSLLTGLSHDEVLVAVTIPDLLEYSERKFMTKLSLSSNATSPLIPMDRKLKGLCEISSSVHCRIVEGDKKPGEKSADKVICEVWMDGFERSRSEIPGVKDVYINHNVIGNPQIDSNGNMYFISESSDKTHRRGYFESAEDESVSGKFRLTTDFGETMLKTRETKLMKFSTHLKSFNDIGSDSVFPIFVCPLPDSEILITGLVRSNSLFTPGLSRCFNRETRLYSSTDGYSVPLTPNMFMALAPIPSPSGQTVAFIGSENRFDTHCTELDIFTITKTCSGWSSPIKLETRKNRDDFSPTPTFNGVFLSAQGESELVSFLPDNETLVLPSFANGRSGIFLIDTRSGIEQRSNPVSVFPPEHAGKLSSVILLRVIGTNVLFTHSGYTCQRSLWVAKIKSPDKIEYRQLLSSPKLDERICAGFHGAKISVIQGTNCPAWLLRSGRSDGSKRPLIAYFHGGPFMGAVSSFSVEMAAFLSQGYDVVIPNYRGSFSYGRNFLHELEGFVGIKDVDDCQDCVDLAKDMCNPSLVIAYGGSHGGFLTGWLLGHPEHQATYAGGILWNPAVDLISSNLTSDIPDWAVNVAMGKVDNPMEKFAPSIDFINKAYRQSPMSVVKNVKAPSLVLLGSNDRRVVPCAGLRWAQAAKENGADVDVHWYPEQGHAIAGPEFYETAIVTIGLWIKQKFT